MQVSDQWAGAVHQSTSRTLIEPVFWLSRLIRITRPPKQWFKDQTSQLTGNSNCLSTWLPFYLEQEEQRLLICLVPDPIGEQALLLLEEQELPLFSIAALELLGLTKREAEVLFWIAKDKSNVEIAKILDCCEGTVRKHLERLYKKLEVQTRMGAAMAALERLGLLQV